MTEEEKVAVLWEIAHKVDTTDTTHEVDTGPIECIFCNGDYNYKYEIYKHDLDCPVTKARALVATPVQKQSALDHVDNCMKMLDISLSLLDPKRALGGGPAGTMEQMMLVETVKDDFRKLSDAIKALRKSE